jgi:cold-inducible RNA-binding protein
MNPKLYVGNLSYQTNEESLRTLFSEVAPVASVAVIMDRDTGRSKGFGFVEMETSEGAKEAIEKLNNRELDSRTITVSEARPKKEGGGRGGDGGFGGGRGGYGGGGGGRKRY